MAADVISALIAASAALLLGLFNAAYTYRSTREMHETDARREYEYEARKRLYEECEPLIFQTLESAEVARRRVRSIARKSCNGTLLDDPDEGQPLMQISAYYMRSTLYVLFAPAALFALLRKKLTSVDLMVEPTIAIQYQLMKLLYRSFTHAERFAEFEPTLSRQRRPDDVPLGRLDAALEAMLIADETKGQRLKTFGEFESNLELLVKGTASEALALRPLVDLFAHFSPENVPVVWRMLLAQAHIYRGLLLTREPHSDVGLLLKALRDVQFTKDQQSKYIWSQDGSPRLHSEFEAAHTYYRTYLRRATRTLPFADNSLQPAEGRTR